MKKALVHGERICEVRDEEFPVAAPLKWVSVPDDTRAGEDRYVDGAVVKPEPPAPLTIQSVTMRQARLALLEVGLLGDVESVVQAAGGAVSIEWEYATEVRRDWPVVIQLCESLGLSASQVDGLFDLASTK